MLDVVTVWAPRPQHPKWRGDEYLELLALQAQTVKRVRHRHVVVTDAVLTGYQTLQAALPESLMHALIEGQLAYLRQWSDAHPVVLVDIDVLIVRNLEKAFDGTFDIGVTSRELKGQEIQNGVMYFAAGSKKWALKMLEKTLALCGEGWGTDQEALSKALGPIPRVHRVEQRLGGARIAFLQCETHNFSPKHGMPKHSNARFAFHFKGDTKQFAADAAKRHFLLPGAE